MLQRVNGVVVPLSFGSPGIFRSGAPLQLWFNRVARGPWATIQFNRQQFSQLKEHCYRPFTERLFDHPLEQTAAIRARQKCAAGLCNSCRVASRKSDSSASGGFAAWGGGW
jgi:hypothetical protein